MRLREQIEALAACEDSQFSEADRDLFEELCGTLPEAVEGLVGEKALA